MKAPVLAKIAGMSELDRAYGQSGSHAAIIKSTLRCTQTSRRELWYGMPRRYAKDGNVASASSRARRSSRSQRYATFGFKRQGRISTKALCGRPPFALQESDGPRGGNDHC